MEYTPRRKLTREFKLEAVRQVAVSEKPKAQLARELGVRVGQPAPYVAVVLAESLRPQLSDPVVRARVDAELSKLLHDVNESLATFERLQVLVVAREPWSIENGFLTPTMKLKRSRVEAALAAQVDAWYAETGPVVRA